MIERIREVLRGERKVVFAYLYGSYVRNKRYAKDIDIAIFVKGRPSLSFERKLGLKISKIVGKDVEVVTLNDKPLLFISEVLRNCRLVFSRDERTRIDYETRMLSRIQDFNELMKEYDSKRFERYGVG